MEEYSQIEAINQGHAGKLVLMNPLLPKAELYLMSTVDWKNKSIYNANYKMAPASFLSLVKSSYSTHTEELICAYADKWGLTKELYYALLQSSYKGLAPFLKRTVDTE